MKRKRKTSLKNEPQTKAKAMDRQYKEQKPLPLTLPLTIVLPDGTHKVTTEENLPELPVKTEDLNKLEHQIKKEDQAVMNCDDVKKWICGDGIETRPNGYNPSEEEKGDVVMKEEEEDKDMKIDNN